MEEKLSEDQKELINASLEALAALEEGIKVTQKLGEHRACENMQELCKLVEQMMYSSREDVEKNFERITKEMEDRCDMLVGQALFAQYKYRAKK